MLVWQEGLLEKIAKYVIQPIAENHLLNVHTLNRYSLIDWLVELHITNQIQQTYINV